MKQTFTRKNKQIDRIVSLGENDFETALEDRADSNLSAEAAWWQSVLRGAAVKTVGKPRPYRVVDAFCGSGGLGLGLSAAIEAVGGKADFIAGIDTDSNALVLHQYNLGTRKALSISVSSLVDFHALGVGSGAKFGYEPEVVHPALQNTGTIDFFIAGPPCQGHSNLNNHTRRQDPRNELYVSAVALGVALKARVVIIENVPTVQNSHSDVVATGAGLLRSAGYGVSMAILKADELGAAQRRARHFLVGVRDRNIGDSFLEQSASTLIAPWQPLSWAIGDLVGFKGSSLFDTSPSLNLANQSRIDYLFDNNEYNLPDAQRPDCHKNGTTYTAVYGRMYWDRSAQTITTGFGTPGQGRYIHPLERRVITPHEAARIQGFPDWFDFAPDGLPPKRKNLAKWIGDAVHPILGYAVGLTSLMAIEEFGKDGLSVAA